MKQFINPINGFPKMYTGFVASYDSEYTWYKIYYEDGDEEEMSIEEVSFYKKMTRRVMNKRVKEQRAVSTHELAPGVFASVTAN